MQFKNKKQIVKSVQQSLGLQVDGIDGPNTWAAISAKILPQSKEPEKPNFKDDYPEKFIKTPNQGGKISPKFIVLHHSSGSHDGTKSWILSPESQVSYHYLINKDGSRTQFVADTKRAWHAGLSSWKGYSGLNSCSVSVSFFGDTYKREVSDIEIDSCAKKCIYLMEKFNLKVDSIVTHAMISPDRKDDCSPETFDRVINRIKELD